jgi:hypothetical protein
MGSEGLDSARRPEASYSLFPNKKIALYSLAFKAYLCKIVSQ